MYVLRSSVIGAQHHPCLNNQQGGGGGGRSPERKDGNASALFHYMNNGTKTKIKNWKEITKAHPCIHYLLLLVHWSPSSPSHPRLSSRAVHLQRLSGDKVCRSSFISNLNLRERYVQPDAGQKTISSGGPFLQVLIIPWSSVFVSSDGGWLLPVSWAELSGLALAFVERCRRVPFPMQRMRFFKVAHISSSL